MTKQIEPCLIIAAGQGSRLSDLTDCKPLLPVQGRALIEHVCLGMARAGVREFLVVTGYRGERIRERLTNFGRDHSLTIDFVENEDWRLGNGISVVKAGTRLTGAFFLTMADHLFDTRIIEILRATGVPKDGVRLAADFRIDQHPWVDLADVTRVWIEAEKIREIGKNLTRFNAFDTGLFLATPGLFSALTESIAAGDDSLSGGIRRLAGQDLALATDIGERFWIDVDDRAAVARALRAWTWDSSGSSDCQQDEMEKTRE